MTVFAPTAPVHMSCDQPMSLDDAKRWIDSYNRWVEVWNKHETSKDLPLSPEWPEADKVASGMGAIPASVLAFHPKNGITIGLIRLRKWRSYHNGWSLCRNQADATNIIWAGWQRG
jgi:hypothetical protein